MIQREAWRYLSRHSWIRSDHDGLGVDGCRRVRGHHLTHPELHKSIGTPLYDSEPRQLMLTIGVFIEHIEQRLIPTIYGLTWFRW